MRSRASDGPAIGINCGEDEKDKDVDVDVKVFKEKEMGLKYQESMEGFAGIEGTGCIERI